MATEWLPEYTQIYTRTDETHVHIQVGHVQKHTHTQHAHFQISNQRPHTPKDGEFVGQCIDDARTHTPRLFARHSKCLFCELYQLKPGTRCCHRRSHPSSASRSRRCREIPSEPLHHHARCILGYILFYAILPVKHSE